MLKRDELEQPTSCINKSAPDEPVFVLCARDPLAASAVEYWAKQAEATGLHSAAKTAEARQLASTMRVWRAAKPDKVCESRAPYGAMPDHATMEAIRRKEERRGYKMSAAMMGGTTILTALVRENEGKPLSDRQLRDAASQAERFAEYLAERMLPPDEV